jgi:hypothetical protein
MARVKKGDNIAALFKSIVEKTSGQSIFDGQLQRMGYTRNPIP